ncbi:hypothetical protein [Actinomadura harenae]|uniref:Uncharacterized protein n=1 Tax=Actinomadura harenae TaxID=2483351 RepID=A0A3M2LIL2_9ACTN|nr:hypothetical protein [Actinomadura harenae]RMI37304.1 hypothetical protein EBO15_36235 [Actinomadura harenae]
MSDQGERGARWTDMSEHGADGEMADAPTGPLPAQPAAGRSPRATAETPTRTSFPEVEVKVPEVSIPEPTGRTEFSEPDPAPADEPEPAPAEYHDVWGKVEAPHMRRREPEPEPERGPGASRAQAAPDAAPAADAARVEPRGYEDAPSVEAKLTQETHDLADVVGPVEFDVEPDGRHEPGAVSPESGPWWHDKPREPVPAWEEPKPAPAHERAPSVREAMTPSAPQGEPSAPQTGGRAEPTFHEAAYSEGADTGAPRRGKDVPVTQSAHDADVKVAPVDEPAPQGGAWEGTLFEGGDEGGGDGRYAAVADPTAASASARPGRPSSGNWQMPGWMADEKAADDMLVGGGAPSSGGSGGPGGFDDETGGGRSTRVALFGGVGVLVVALVAAGGVYFMQKKKDAPTSSASTVDRPGVPAPTRKSHAPKPQLPPDKPLASFAGKPGKIAGRVADAKSGLSYPRFAEPWQVPTKKNKLGVTGWSGQQILVTEKHGDQLWYGQLLTGSLAATLLPHYKGPESLKAVAVLAASGFDKDYYSFQHESTPLASQALTVGAHKGWLVARYLKYKRPGVRATGEVVVTAVVDTGHKTPAVAFASLPNTHRKLWPDINAFVDGLKVAP